MADMQPIKGELTINITTSNKENTPIRTIQDVQKEQQILSKRIDKIYYDIEKTVGEQFFIEDRDVKTGQNAEVVKFNLAKKAIKKYQEQQEARIKEVQVEAGKYLDSFSEVPEIKGKFSGTFENSSKIAKNLGMYKGIPTKKEWDEYLRREKIKKLENLGIKKLGGTKESPEYTEEQLKAIKFSQLEMQRMGSPVKMRETAQEGIKKKQQEIAEKMADIRYRELLPDEQEYLTKLRNLKSKAETDAKDDSIPVWRKTKFETWQQKHLDQLEEILKYSQEVENEAQKYGVIGGETKAQNTQKYSIRQSTLQMQNRRKESGMQVFNEERARLERINQRLLNLSQELDQIDLQERQLQQESLSAYDPQKPHFTTKYGYGFKGKNGKWVEGGDRVALEGKFLYEYNKDYEAAQKEVVKNKLARRKLTKESMAKYGASSEKELIGMAENNPEILEVIKKLDLYDTEILKWKNKAEEIVSKLVTAFEGSTEEMQQKVLSSINFEDIAENDEEKIKKVLGDKYESASQETKDRIGRIIGQIEKESFEGVGGQFKRGSSDWTKKRFGDISLYEALRQRTRSSQFDWALDSEDETTINYGGEKTPEEIKIENKKKEEREIRQQREEEKEASYGLKSFISVLQSQDFKDIIKSDPDTAKKLIDEMFSSVENIGSKIADEGEVEKAQIQQANIDTLSIEELREREVNEEFPEENDNNFDPANPRKMTSVAQTGVSYNEYLAAKENAPDPVQEQVKETLAFQLRTSLLDELNKIITGDDVTSSANAALLKRSLGLQGLETGKRATTVEEDIKQAYQRISNILTFADNVDEALRNVPEQFRNIAFSNEQFKERYEESKRVKEVWNQMGGKYEPDLVMQQLFGVPRQESPLYSIPSNELNNIFSVLERIGQVSPTQIIKEGEVQEEFASGLAEVLSKAVQRITIGKYSPDKGGNFYSTSDFGSVELLDEEKMMELYAPAERTNLFYKGGTLAYAMGETNLEKARVKAEGLLKEELSQKTQDISKIEWLKGYISQIDAWRKTEEQKLEEQKVIVEQEKEKLKVDNASQEPKKGFYNVKLVNDSYIESMEERDATGKLFRSGQGLKLGNTIGFVEDWANKYEKLNPENKQKMLQKLMEVRNSWTKEQKEQFDAQLEGKTLKTDLIALQKENNVVEELNQNYSEHSEMVEKASQAEKGKILVSKELATALDQEQDKIQEVNSDLKDHAKIAEENNNVSISYEPVDFDEENHKYYLKGTKQEVDFTATGIAGLAFSDYSRQSGIDFKKLSNNLKLAALGKAEFSPESLGILDKNTGKPDQKTWNFLTKSLASTLTGTALHKVGEMGAKYEVDTLEDLKNKMSSEDLSEFNNTLNLLTKELKILGVDIGEVDFQKFLTAYMDMKFPKDIAGNRNFEKPLLTETPLGARIKVGNKEYTVGATADALFAGKYGSELIDFKTGKVNPEKNTFQLSLNRRIIEEAVKSGAFSEISEKDLKEVVNTIYHYVNGEMIKILYGQLSDEQIGEIVANVAEGKVIPKEQRARYNLESQIGRQSTVKPGETTSESLGFTGNDREIYRAMMNDVKEMQKAKKQIAVLDAAISKSSGDVKKDLEAQKSSQEDILNLAQQAYEQSKAQLSLDQTKEQLLENERQREQRVDLSQTEIDAAAEKALQQAQAKVSKDALKNFKNSNKAVLDQQLELERAQLKLSQYSGDSDKERKALEMNVETQQRLLELKKQDQALLDGNILKYKNVNGEWQEIELSQEQVAQAQKTLNDLTDTYAGKSAKVQATIKESTGLFDKLFSGLKRSVMNLIDYSLAGILVGKVRESVSQVLEITKQLDAALVDLQIAAGTSREETSAMLLEYNDLAKEVGRTTQEVAEASNDWLRAGYEGAEAAELTRASMELSTLGMIDASTATTDLISVLKGWKLETEDVGSVVDKLTVIVCGVCQVIGIGHELKCR